MTTMPRRRRMTQDAPQGPQTTERAFQAQVEQYARLCGFLVYHTYRSTKSAPGFPDILAVRPGVGGGSGRVLAIELKTCAGKISPDQVQWGEAFAAVGGNVEYYLWRANENGWREIERVLGGAR